jgi:hypothetical protein
MKTSLSVLSSRLKNYLWLLPALIAGTAIRLFNLSSQIIGGDEMHTVRIALQKPLGWILTHYVTSDNCIPLTAFYRVQMDLGVRFTEMTFRLPILALGIVFLIIAPLILKDKIGKRPAFVLSWLIALAPLLVFYSRMVRPYMASVFLSFAAAMCFFDWLGSRKLSAGTAYAVLSAMAIYFHLTTAPFVLAPLAYFLLEKGLRKEWDRKELLSLFVIAGLTAGILLFFLVPALPSLIPFVSEKAMDSSVNLETVRVFFHLFAGTRLSLLTALFWIVSFGGFVKLVLKRGRFALYSLFLLAFQLAAVSIISPKAVQSPVIFSRYMLAVLPFVLTWVAFGLADPWWKGQRKTKAWIQEGAVIVFIAGLFLAGPLCAPQFYSSPFAHHARQPNFYDSGPFLSDKDIPAFYERLKDKPGGALIEYPWDWVWLRSVISVAYQNRHRRDLIVSGVRILSADKRIRFRNHVPMNPESFLSSRARYLIVHLDPCLEEEAVISPQYRAPLFSNKDFCDRMRRMGTNMSNKLGKLWGVPIYKDRFIRVWDLEQVRNWQKTKSLGEF